MENNITGRFEKLMGSLDGMKKASAPDFFYTRLSGRMQKKNEIISRPVFQLKPVLLITTLALVLVVNLVSLNRFKKPSVLRESVNAEKPATIETFAESYGLNSTTVYE